MVFRIGANYHIMPGVTIGENATLLQGLLLRRVFLAGTISAGVPGKVIKTLLQVIPVNHKNAH